MAIKEKALQVVEKLRAMRLAKAAEIVEAGIDEPPSYYAMPPEHWRCLRTNPESKTNISTRIISRAVHEPIFIPDRPQSWMVLSGETGRRARLQWNCHLGDPNSPFVR